MECRQQQLLKAACFFSNSMKRQFIIGLSAILALAVVFFAVSRFRDKNQKRTVLLPPAAQKENVWIAPDTGLIPQTPEGELIRYGRSIIANTAYYFGPAGKINHRWNGMNC